MKKRLLLLIEDNPLLTGMYSAAFEKAGFEVIFAHDGETGLVMAKEKKPDGIILDFLMPGMDGLEVLSELKKDTATRKIKVIILTVVAQKKYIDKAKELGVVDYLLKPELDLNEIVNRITSHFNPRE